MTWSYDPTQLATNEVYQVRNEIGDVDVNYQLLQNEEITWNLSQERDFWSGCARCVEQIARLFLRKADVRLGRSMQIQYAKMSEQYLLMAKSLRQKALGTVPPFVGGMSVSDKIAYRQDTDLVVPSFQVGMMENPWTGGYTPDSLAPVGGGDSVDDGDNDID